MHSLTAEQLAKMERSLRRSSTYCRKLHDRLFKLRWPHVELWDKAFVAERALDELYGLVRMLEGEAQKRLKK